MVNLEGHHFVMDHTQEHINQTEKFLTEDVFTKKYGTGIDNIKIVENYFNKDQCQYAMNLMKQFSIIPNRKHLYSIDLAPGFDDPNSTIMNYSNTVGRRITNDASELWNEPLTRYKHAYLTVHPTGSVLNPHTDILDLHYPETDPDNNLPYYYLGDEKIQLSNNMEDQAKIFPNMWSGHLAILVYLNDDYEGGELYFPRYDYSIKPSAGTMITFPGSLYYIHGVKEITKGVRYTINQWSFFNFLEGVNINIEEIKKYRKTNLS